MTHDERLAKLEERVSNLCDDIEELKKGQQKIIDMLMNGFLETKVKNMIKQQIGGWILKVFLSGSTIAAIVSFLLGRVFQ